MNKAFTITADNKPVVINGTEAAELAVSVANTSGKEIQALARIVAIGQTKAEWLTLTGNQERRFPVGGTQQFVVRIAVPEGTQPGKYSLRLNAASVQNPDEEYAEGPAVAFVVEASAAPQEPVPTKSSWKFIASLAALVCGGLGIGYLALRPSPTVNVTANTYFQNATVLLKCKPEERSLKPEWTIRHFTEKGIEQPAQTVQGEFAVQRLNETGSYTITLSTTWLGMRFRSKEHTIKTVPEIVREATKPDEKSPKVAVGPGPNQIFTPEPKDPESWVKYVVEIPAGMDDLVSLQLSYSIAGGSRPVMIQVNDNPAVTAPCKATGSWEMNTNQTVEVAKVKLIAGAKNTIRISSKSYFPHISAIKLCQ